MSPALQDASKSYRDLLNGPDEPFWHDHCDWLRANGYLLRSRCRADRAPSWIGIKKDKFDYEDSQTYMYPRVMDATRISDGSFVLLKYIDTKLHPHEIEIGTWLSEEPRKSDTANHCIPFIAVLKKFDNPRFDTVGEAVEFFRQIFEGLQCMHKNNFAHRDVSCLNIMMDAAPIHPIAFHPASPDMKRDFSGTVSHLTRTQRPVKYYLIDFGISRKYDPAVRAPIEPIIVGGDKSVPEFRRKKTGELPMECDAFPADVYCMGNVIREEFLDRGIVSRKKLGLEFIRPLIDDMTRGELAAWPTRDELLEGLTTRKLRSRVAIVDDPFGFYFAITHRIRRISYLVHRTAPVPSPKYLSNST
ncbi:hypothetical protein DFH09DRAFT_1246055 [Mycena vulgaris]|nr:hypothetical protein DFH09DRAFT_1246055 [Mycena vulgaris]